MNFKFSYLLVKIFLLQIMFYIKLLKGSSGIDIFISINARGFKSHRFHFSLTLIIGPEIKLVLSSQFNCFKKMVE